MTRKQIKKLANELTELELIHQKSSDKEEIMRVEKRIMSITSQLMSDPNALSAMMDIDDLVQQKLKKINIGEQKSN